MSMRHQVELLFLVIKGLVEQQIKNMTLNEIQQLLQGGHAIRFSPEEFRNESGYLCINDQIALPVYAVNKSVSSIGDLPIIEAGGSILANLVMTSRLGLCDVGMLTDHQFIAYLTDVELSQYGASYEFKRDYVVVAVANIGRYTSDFLKTAGLWGGFSHAPAATATPASASVGTTEILADKELELPTIYHEETLLQATQGQYAFERYLKLYHLLELMFDWALVEELRSLGADLKGIGELLSRYSSKELNRLRWVFEGSIDTDKLATFVDSLDFNRPQLKTILYDFSKDGNPIKEFSEFAGIIASGGWSKSAHATRRRKPEDPVAHRRFLLDAVAYWVYRIRCCIAHSRIGEYVMSLSDEVFVVDFAEPLIRHIVLQVFRK